EIITEVRVPKTTGDGVAYKKFHHPASGYAVVGVAVRLKKSANKIEAAAVGITGVSEIAYRANAVENALRGKPLDAIADAAEHAASSIVVIGDVYASAEYRRHLVTVITRRALVAAAHYGFEAKAFEHGHARPCSAALIYSNASALHRLQLTPMLFNITRPTAC